MKAIIAIGLPGCGKTTLLKPMAATEGLSYVNADDIREELTGAARDHSQELAVWKMMHKRIEAGLNGSGVIIDATFTRRKSRTSMIDFCRKNGAKAIIGYWLDTPASICKERNKKRAVPVPEEAIAKMERRLKLNPPMLEEGFDEIIRVS